MAASRYARGMTSAEWVFSAAACLTDDTCIGLCQANRCVDPCVIGALLACSAVHSKSELGAACVLPVSGSGVGDLGLCAVLCDCSSDCADDEFCRSWDFLGKFKAAGACERGPRPSGMPDCLDEGTDASHPVGCAYGAIRACKTATCLGTAACLPDGSYGMCECLPMRDAGGSSNDPDGDIDTGAIGAGAPSTGVTETTRGCNCAIPRTRSHGVAIAFVCFIISITACRVSRNVKTRRK
jgi:hypothetical protein